MNVFDVVVNTVLDLKGPPTNNPHSYEPKTSLQTPT